MKDKRALYKKIHDNGDVWLIRKNCHPTPIEKTKKELPICLYLTIRYPSYSEAEYASSENNNAFEIVEEYLSATCDGKLSIFAASMRRKVGMRTTHGRLKSILLITQEIK